MPLLQPLVTMLQCLDTLMLPEGKVAHLADSIAEYLTADEECYQSPQKVF